VLTLKGNQGTMHRSVVAHLEERIANDLADGRARCHVEHDTGHGRRETRTYVRMPAPRHLPGVAAWPTLRTIGAVISCSLREGREVTHTRYYVSSLRMGVKQFAPGRPWPLGHRELVPLESGRHVPRGRVADPGAAPGGEFRLAGPLHAVAPETTPRQGQHRHETPQLRLGRRLPDASLDRPRGIVSAGPVQGGEVPLVRKQANASP
jgi:hypothetical protein